ncbi:MAG: hypothetical protein ACP5TY_05095 [Thermodesulforhabdaceae bacterium]
MLKPLSKEVINKRQGKTHEGRLVKIKANFKPQKPERWSEFLRPSVMTKKASLTVMLEEPGIKKHLDVIALVTKIYKGLVYVDGVLLNEKYKAGKISIAVDILLADNRQGRPPERARYIAILAHVEILVAKGFMREEVFLVRASEIERFFPWLEPRFLANLRSQGHGPKYCRKGKLIFYCPEDIENWLKGQCVRTVDRP